MFSFWPFNDVMTFNDGATVTWLLAFPWMAATVVFGWLFYAVPGCGCGGRTNIKTDVDVYFGCAEVGQSCTSDLLVARCTAVKETEVWQTVARTRRLDDTGFSFQTCSQLETSTTPTSFSSHNYSSHHHHYH